MTSSLKLKFLRTCPALHEKAALWFGGKWNISPDLYRKSIGSAGTDGSAVPQWYVLVDEDDNIVAGAGVIENDFHERRDLSPNVCALFVEEAHRGRGVARYLLDRVRRDMGELGVERLYLVTDHSTFYEKCGWTFVTMVRGEDGTEERMYAAPTLAGASGAEACRRVARRADSSDLDVLPELAMKLWPTHAREELTAELRAFLTDDDAAVFIKNSFVF